MSIKINGVDIAFDWIDTAGAAAPVLTFAHCLGGDRTIWRHQLAHWRGRYRLLPYDLRGQGGSGVTPAPYAMAQLAADALALLDAQGIERTVFLGVSMGGMVALQVALLAPQRVSALVLADTAGGFGPEARAAWAERIAAVARDGVAPLTETMMGRWFTEAYRKRSPAAVAEVSAALSRTPVEGYLGACAAIRDFDLRERLGEVACPTLVLCGENDPSTPLALSRELAAGIPGARLRVFPGANHLPNFEMPEPFNAAVDEFLAAAEPRAV
jgi:3-oxoadipate enol-lactonase